MSLGSTLPGELRDPAKLHGKAMGESSHTPAPAQGVSQSAAAGGQKGPSQTPGRDSALSQAPVSASPPRRPRLGPAAPTAGLAFPPRPSPRPPTPAPDPAPAPPAPTAPPSLYSPLLAEPHWLPRPVPHDALGSGLGAQRSPALSPTPVLGEGSEARWRLWHLPPPSLRVWTRGGAHTVAAFV